MAEILRMLAIAFPPTGDSTSLLQSVKKEAKPPSSRVKIASDLITQGTSEREMESDEVQLMQREMTDNFGGAMQRLLIALEKYPPQQAGRAADFMTAMLKDWQRPGHHVAASVIERMDRVQAMLATFQLEGHLSPSEDMREEQCQWCLTE